MRIPLESHNRLQRKVDHAVAYFQTQVRDFLLMGKASNLIKSERRRRRNWGRKSRQLYDEIVALKRPVDYHDVAQLMDLPSSRKDWAINYLAGLFRAGYLREARRKYYHNGRGTLLYLPIPLEEHRRIEIYRNTLIRNLNDAPERADDIVVCLADRIGPIADDRNGRIIKRRLAGEHYRVSPKTTGLVASAFGRLLRELHFRKKLGRTTELRGMRRVE